MTRPYAARGSNAQEYRLTILRDLARKGPLVTLAPDRSEVFAALEREGVILVTRGTRGDVVMYYLAPFEDLPPKIQEIVTLARLEGDP